MSDLRLVPPPLPDGEMIRRETAEALHAELKAAELREVRLLIEISQLHEALGYVRACCETAKALCMHRRSIQATTLDDAIRKTRERLP